MTLYVVQLQLILIFKGFQISFFQILSNKFELSNFNLNIIEFNIHFRMKGLNLLTLVVVVEICLGIKGLLVSLVIRHSLE